MNAAAAQTSANNNSSVTESRPAVQAQPITPKQPSRLTEALLETATDMRRSGVINAATQQKIAVRHLAETTPLPVEPITGKYFDFDQRRGRVT